MTKPYDSNNIFAKILRGEIPCNRVYENDYALAFHDLYPQAPTHTLVIPKGAYTDFDDFSYNASEKEIVEYIKAVGHVARLCGVEMSGYRLISNCRDNGGQEVPHLHVHILGGTKIGPLVSKKN